MSKKFDSWDEFEKELNITEEDEEMIKLEMESMKNQRTKEER